MSSIISYNPAASALELPENLEIMLLVTGNS